MRKSISILGCGWLGLSLAEALTKLGYQVKGSTTTVNKLEHLKSGHIEPFIVDISKKEIGNLEFFSSEILIIAITSKEINDYKNLIQQIEKSPIKKVIFVSSTSVYPNNNQTTTEKSPVLDTSLVQIENLFSNSSFKTTIIRFGGLVGYNRHPGNFHKRGALIKNPEGTVNLIHRDDCISIIEQIITQDVWNSTFNACSDSHPTRRAFYTKKRKEIGILNTLFVEGGLTAFKTIDSSKIKQQLNYKFLHPNLMITFV